MDMIPTYKPHTLMDVHTLRDEVRALDERLATVEAMQVQQSATLAAQNLQAQRIETNTKDLLETFQAFQGAWKVLNFIGKLAKPLSYIASFGAGWYYFKDHVKDFFK